MSIPEGFYPADMNTPYWQRLFEWEGARQYARWALQQDAGAALAHPVTGSPFAALLRSLGLVDRWSMLLAYLAAHGHLPKPALPLRDNVTFFLQRGQP